MMKILFDTSVLVDCLRGNSKATSQVERVARKEVEGLISVLTEAELYAGRECDTVDGLSRVGNIISLFTKILLTSDIAQQAGFFKRRYKIELPDAIIAATAYVHGTKVWTKNIKEFERIKEIRTEDPY
jgi:predicted nucleic acid-binding protein